MQITERITERHGKQVKRRGILAAGAIFWGLVSWGLVSFGPVASAAPLLMTVNNCTGTSIVSCVGQILSIDTSTPTAPPVVVLNNVPLHPDSLITVNGAIVYTVSSGAVYTYSSGSASPTRLTTITSNSLKDIVADPSKTSVVVADNGGNALYRVTLANGATQKLGGTFIDPDGLAYDSSGNLYVTVNNDGIADVLRINPSTGAVVTTGVSVSSAYFDGLTYDAPSGRLWVTDSYSNCLRSVDLATLTPSACLATIPSPYTAESVSSDGSGFLYIGSQVVEGTGAGAVYRYPVTGGGLTNLYTSGSNYIYDVIPGNAAAPPTFTCTATPASSTFTTATSVTTTVSPGATYTVTCTAAGGTPPYPTVNTPIGSTPPWLQQIGQTTSSFTLSGTVPPSPSSYNFGYSITDSAGQTSPVFSITINVVGLTITCPTVASSVGTAYTNTCAAAPGKAPYTFTPSTSSPAGFSLSSSGVITGTPTGVGNYTIVVAASDGSTPPLSGSINFTIAVNVAQLQITGCTGATSSGPSNFSITLSTVPITYTCTATGGNLPYAWTAATATGVSINTAGVVSVTSLSATSIPLTVRDSSFPPLTATATLSFVALPSVNLSLGSSTAPQPTPVVSISNPSTSAVNGTLTLSYTNSQGLTLPANYIDPSLQFASGCTTTSVPCTSIKFTIPANCTQAIVTGTGGTGCPTTGLPAFSPGSVAGTVNLTASGVTAGTTPVTAPSPTTMTVAKAAPANLSVSIINKSSTGLTVDILGSTPTRDMTNAVLTFTATSGDQLTGGNSVTVPLSTAAAPFFADTTRSNRGGGFEVQIPFSYTGDPNAVGSVSVQLTNSAGSTTATGK